MPLPTRTAIVIGAGFGGLALGIRLQSAGVQTTLVEARDKPGGRAYFWEKDGHTFDAGPTVITDPKLTEIANVDLAAPSDLGYDSKRGRLLAHATLDELRGRSGATSVRVTGPDVARLAALCGPDAERVFAAVAALHERARGAYACVAEIAGYGILADHGGHGVGQLLHEDPSVDNDGRPGRGYRLRPGLLLALEPWVMADTAELVTDADGWTLRSATGCRTAHSEHTIAITDDGAEILTLPKHARP